MRNETHFISTLLSLLELEAHLRGSAALVALGNQGESEGRWGGARVVSHDVLL